MICKGPISWTDDDAGRGGAMASLTQRDISPKFCNAGRRGGTPEEEEGDGRAIATAGEGDGAGESGDRQVGSGADQTSGRLPAADRQALLPI